MRLRRLVGQIFAVASFVATVIGILVLIVLLIDIFRDGASRLSGAFLNGFPSRFALGFMKSTDNRRRVRGDRDTAILSSAAFGHVGAGGSIGFADPEAGFSFGYSMNQMGPGILLNERGQSLVDAAYRALGFRSNEGGVWAR